jgi:hypothetical protein
MRGKRKTYKILIGRHEDRRTLGKPRRIIFAVIIQHATRCIVICGFSGSTTFLEIISETA